MPAEGGRKREWAVEGERRGPEWLPEKEQKGEEEMRWRGREGIVPRFAGPRTARPSEMRAAGGCEGRAICSDSRPKAAG